MGLLLGLLVALGVGLFYHYLKRAPIVLEVTESCPPPVQTSLHEHTTPHHACGHESAAHKAPKGKRARRRSTHSRA